MRLLALSAAHPHRRFSAATVGRGRRGVGVATIAPLDADVAIGHLAVLLDLHARGMREPLPLYCDTSAAYAAAPSGGRSVRARKEWTTPSGGFDREDRDAAHVLVLGDEVPFDDLELAVPADDESRSRMARRRVEPVRSLRPALVGGAARPRAAQRAVSAPRHVRRVRAAAVGRDAARGERRDRARRSRSPPWRPATSPRARRWSTCCS